MQNFLSRKYISKMSSINWLTLCPHLNICPSWLLTLRIHILPHSGHSLPCLQASRHLSNCSSPSLPPWATSWNQSRHTSVNSCIFWSMKSGDRVAYVTPSRLGFVGAPPVMEFLHKRIFNSKSAMTFRKILVGILNKSDIKCRYTLDCPDQHAEGWDCETEYHRKSHESGHLT